MKRRIKVRELMQREGCESPSALQTGGAKCCR